MMKPNLHPWDRILRGVIGVVVIAFGLFNGDFLEEPIIEILIIIFGVLNLVSLATGWCPVYSLANIDTRSKKP
ncbi:YgaP family membrane protein [Marinomonas ostreistagni]|uniref:DUF2892 domain-containing protein n=1 Tax=Marinomonas ostreistagni TaxID=359209 RepID=A0ABS0Z8D4_9GAMM|nr:DUF2892 domain-containing protein [Marinomonas ostreistagni]MBJ7549914.1 DUF2892 domain-containing protein [Marinomonas ostreistagni]